MNTELELVFRELANDKNFMPLYDQAKRVLTNASKWVFGFDRNEGIRLKNLFSGNICVEIHLSVKLKKQVVVSLNIIGMALNIEELGWTRTIPYLELEQPVFAQRLSAVFPHGKNDDTDDAFKVRVLEFLKQYSE